MLAGAGGASTASYSPYTSADTAGVHFWGAGVTFPVNGWNLHIDGQQVWMPVTSGGRGASYELQIGIGRAFATTPAPIPPEPRSMRR